MGRTNKLAVAARGGAFRHTVATLTAGVAVGGLLFGMAWLKVSGAPEAQPEAVHQATVIEVVQRRQPPRRRHRPQNQRRIEARAPAPHLPSLDLPSSVALPTWEPPPPTEPGVLHAGVNDVFDLPEAGRVFEEEMVDEPPRVVFRQAPRYPPAAEAQGVEGDVRARLLVAANGRVQQVTVVEGRPAGVFDDAATAALRRYLFRPARFHGEAVPVWVRQRLVFRLE